MLRRRALQIEASQAQAAAINAQVQLKLFEEETGGAAGGGDASGANGVSTVERLAEAGAVQVAKLEAVVADYAASLAAERVVVQGLQAKLEEEQAE